jgi:hypothetical protein
MSIFDVIRKIFPSFDSSSTDRFHHHGHSKEVAREFVEDECSHPVEYNPHSNVYAGRRRTANVTSRRSSNITSIAIRSSSKSYTQPDLKSQRENTRKGFKDIFSVSENARCSSASSTECVKTSNTSTNVSLLPRSTESHQIYCYDQSKIFNDDSICVQTHQQNPKPNHSKPTSAEYSTTRVDYRETHKKASDIKILQSTLKTKSFDLDGSCQSRYPTVTSKQAKESNTTIKPGHGKCLPPPSVALHNPVGTTISCHKSKS